MTTIGFEINKEQQEFLIKKLKLDRNSNLSLALQIKKWLLREENIDDPKEQNTILKNKLLKNKINDADLYRRKLEAETKIAEYHADNIDVIGSRPSRTAKTAMKTHVESNEVNQELSKDGIHKETLEEKILAHYSEIEKDKGEYWTVCKHCDQAVFAYNNHGLLFNCQNHIEIEHRIQVRKI